MNLLPGKRFLTPPLKKGSCWEKKEVANEKLLLQVIKPLAVAVNFVDFLIPQFGFGPTL
jgi:hypothetical protein